MHVYTDMSIVRHDSSRKTVFTTFTANSGGQVRARIKGRLLRQADIMGVQGPKLI